jgi:hypothetical protein
MVGTGVNPWPFNEYRGRVGGTTVALPDRHKRCLGARESVVPSIGVS